MVNQSIEQLLQQAVDQSMAQTQESRELADDVSGLIGEIRNEVAQAVQRTDGAIADVNAAIPTAINTELSKTLYLDPNAGDDANMGTSGADAVKTMSRAVALVPEFGGATIELLANLDFVEQIVVANKYLVIDLNSFEFTQSTNAVGSPGNFKLAGLSKVYMGSGGVKTALFDENVTVASRDNALFSRYDNSPNRVAMFSVNLNLGDLWLMANPTVCGGFAELLMSHSSVEINESTVTPYLLYSASIPTLIDVNIFTLPSGVLLKELVHGVTYFPDGSPKNIFSTSDFAQVV
ncbi:hypothetical protein [Vibrio sp. 10N.286.48.B7]|uniref:hypothetical protein n=1 Tax=Vibrio sp. 10N.286.48.B7 TaxID=1880853 RepID=UPI000C8354A6|nr:hypothetical protein [Vibrio sp. 10N.286.48.B7]PMH78712.1 hypothetical protein BCU58_07960 [Vibrio sp. 10N.286.48.B7]